MYYIKSYNQIFERSVIEDSVIEDIKDILTDLIDSDIDYSLMCYDKKWKKLSEVDPNEKSIIGLSVKIKTNTSEEYLDVMKSSMLRIISISEMNDMFVDLFGNLFGEEIDKAKPRRILVEGIPSSSRNRFEIYSIFKDIEDFFNSLLEFENIEILIIQRSRYSKS